MIQIKKGFLSINDEPPEEKELTSLKPLMKELKTKISWLMRGISDTFYEDLSSTIRSLLNNYVLEEKDSKSSPVYKYLYLFCKIYEELKEITFMDQNYLINYLFKRIFLFHNTINSKGFNNIMAIKDSITSLSKAQITPIIHHCLNIIVNKFIFEEKNKFSEMDDFWPFFQNYLTYSELFDIKGNIAEIYFTQLICLDDFANKEIKSILKEENKVKEFIYEKITYLHKLNMENKNNEGDNNSKDARLNFLFLNNFDESTTDLLKYLRRAIINVFTPVDSNVLDFFQINIRKYLDRQKNQSNKKNSKNSIIKLDTLKTLFFENNIQDVDIKVRNLSYLVDIIIQKYFYIQEIKEFDLLKFPRLNILLNRVFTEEIIYSHIHEDELLNAIFEHFIISQFVYNYLKYQLRDPEHYPIEIRYFVVYSYLNIISEQYINTNVFSSYIATLTLREIIQFLKLEKGFKKQKYIKNSQSLNKSDESNLNNSGMDISMKNSSKKKKRKSISRNKKNKKNNKKKSFKKPENKGEVINTSLNDSIYDTFSKMGINSGSKGKEKNSKGPNNSENIDEPEKLLSKTLFNYFCFIYFMENKFEKFSEYFKDFYSFIDDYIKDNINNIKNTDSNSLYNDWIWLYISSFNYIKKFNLPKTFRHFGINTERDNTELNVKLISYLGKKMKYCNTQENFVILDVVYYILINMENLPNIMTSQKYSGEFKKLNRALSFLYFNINNLMHSEEDNQSLELELISDRFFKIKNFLFIDSVDEYFWIPKSVKIYTKFNDFLYSLEELFNKIIFRKTVFTEQLLSEYVAIKKYNNKFNPNYRSNSKKEREREQNILALEYFCKLKIPGLDDIEEIKKYSIIKNYIFNLLEILADEFEFKNYKDDKLDTLKNLLLSGENDLKVCLFIIFHLITNKKLEEKSEQDSIKINLITHIFKELTDEKDIYLVNFAISIYKSIEKYLYDLIDEYVRENFPESNNFSRKEYNKFLYFFDMKRPLEQNNQLGKSIQIIYNNWTLLQKSLESNHVFYNFLLRAKELNYPKTVINIIEKYLFDFTRKLNIHEFSKSDDIPKDNMDQLKPKIKRYLKLYYKSYSLIEENKKILENYFSNEELLLYIFENNNNNSKPSISINQKNIINLRELEKNTESYLINLDEHIFSEIFYAVEEIEKVEANSNYTIFKFIHFLSEIKCLSDKSLSLNQKKEEFVLTKINESRAIIENLFETNLNEINSLMINSIWLYELDIYLKQYEIYVNRCNTDDDFFNNINNLTQKLRNIFINKRKIPHLKRFLIIFEFRRFLFNLYDDKISELYCLMDMCKVYKSIYETGISEIEKNNFREILRIFLTNIIKLDDNILINIDKKLVLVPLKYYVKFFPNDKCIPFEEAYQKYVHLYDKNKMQRNAGLSYKITILPEKLKVKNEVVNINDEFFKKIEELRKNNNQNNVEGFILYTDFYLDQLLNNDKSFELIRPREDIKKIQLSDINENIFNYLKDAINICILTNKEKYLRKYMPEIINLFFKINFAIINFKQNNILNSNISQTQSLLITKFENLLKKFVNDVSINKIKIIIPQLIICYQYENTQLYRYAIQLLASYAEKNIDLIAYLLSSFLIFNEGDLNLIGIKNRRNHHSNDKYNNYKNTFNKSKKFVNSIKDRLNEKNKKILTGYEKFCELLSELFYNYKNSGNLSKDAIIKMRNNCVNQINSCLDEYNIILPTLDNINRYNSSVRDENNNNNNLTNNILFLKELDTIIDVLSSKEKPLHIRFRTRNIKGDKCPKKYYHFLLKCDVNDITKEIKTFEIIDEINNIFKMKHYDTNESMSLRRYLIVPIAPTIILAEWLNDCISLSSAIDEQSKKDLIYQDEYNSIIKNDSNNNPYIIKDSIKNEEEKFNILYNYYQYNFFNPNVWYNAKKKYIISTAIWSMTQFLLGLGDRHLGNIMFNKTDGEVVHIDFGYVALKGLSLGVPEIVDFRLTFNLLKNLGLFGESGLFNYICVKVLKIFKEYYKTLSARIEYYQFDPLFDRENDNKTFKLFEQNDKFFNLLDDVNIKEKLRKLIVKNTNPQNLESMYIWWSPWV